MIPTIKKFYFLAHLCSVNMVSCIYSELRVRYSGCENYMGKIFLIGEN